MHPFFEKTQLRYASAWLQKWVSGLVKTLTHCQILSESILHFMIGASSFSTAVQMKARSSQFRPCGRGVRHCRKLWIKNEQKNVWTDESDERVRKGVFARCLIRREEGRLRRPDRPLEHCLRAQYKSKTNERVLSSTFAPSLRESHFFEWAQKLGGRPAHAPTNHTRSTNGWKILFEESERHLDGWGRYKRTLGFYPNQTW